MIEPQKVWLRILKTIHDFNLKNKDPTPREICQQLGEDYEKRKNSMKNVIKSMLLDTGNVRRMEKKRNTYTYRITEKGIKKLKYYNIL